MGKLTQSPAPDLLGVIIACLFAAGSLANAAGPAKNDAPTPEAPPPIEPSRYAGANLEEYLRAVAGILHAPSRETDPFGLLQDPDSKPIVPKIILPNAPAAVAVPFSEIIPLIRITTIIAPQRKFLVGNRVFSEGEEFPLNFRGKQIRILITEVSAQQVEFKNLETGEVAARRLELLPPGMTAGGSGSTPPGMIPNGADAPLIIDADNPAANPLPAR